MRSRFAAYAGGQVDYVIDTTEPGAPAWEDAPGWADRIRAFSQHTRFVSLQILELPEPSGDEGFVTFRAGLVQEGRDASFSERSRFVRRDGRWRYHSGERLG